MPLGDIERLRLWADLADDPYRAPSTPDPLVLPGSPWEIRSVVVPGTDDIEVVWEHHHETGVVNLLHVGRVGVL